ncbi:Mitochondrial acidic protein mam33 [Entomophthora muscae]|uniref:Mitochondrial acidic protein mam33 n=1 Tax=Entomophthora muscae TaxID=34485 RepID=A0ACC2UE63_9FUNG|nr:Mitochondrial acidic protein mam33 [Entomophthora muscae]
MFRSSLRRIIPNISKVNVASRCSIRPLQQSLFVSSAKSFSTSKVWSNSSGLVDADLKSTLARELGYEKDEGEVEASEEMKEYMEKLPFKIIDKAGEDEVKLVRTFGNETIQVTFSIKDLEIPPESTVPEGEEVDESAIPNHPVRTTIDITKDGAGTMTFEAVIDDGYFNIEMASYYKDSKLAIEDSSEAEWKRHALYGGPVFQDLDEGLQVLFERYIEERGITTDLALFIPNYIQYKEQKEYMKWLENVHDFVKA